MTTGTPAGKVTGRIEGKGRRLPGARPTGFKAAPRAARKRARPPVYVLVLSLAWAAGASWLAVSGHGAARRLAEEAETQRLAHEDRVRALTRRLVGVASHQVLEEEGLSGRLADIITRQVELETRQALLAAMAERALAGVAPGAAAPPPVPERDGDPAPGSRPRRGAEGRDPAAPAAVPPGPRPGRGTRLDDLPARDGPALATRDQFARIEASLGRVEAGQHRIVLTLADSARAAVARVRAVLADLRVALAPAPVPSPAAPDPRDAFAVAVARAEGAFAEAGRWHGVTDSLPLRAPIDGAAALSSNFGMRADPFTGGARMHAGMDFRSPPGTPVRAAAGGRVVTAGPSGGYGNLVEIDHGHDLVTRYGHLSAIQVAVDQPVAAGAVVGLVGSTGRSTGPHLHYETRLSTVPVDPARFLAAGRTLLAAAEAPSESQAVPQAVPQAEAPADAAD
ncbi:M23 family metallopeptidase [Methylobacterium sp. J-090]|uniref:M23 family metallopeptidase n=1 Tax=Methylobacterium sp. J-090 TaxID=2836666 RepID=UPI001FBAD2E7|nr:M23 family metallopeptidase [Methylobacterium sp. J-090]MCJ2081725.1 M23 family metallopeptidase [Methylobacterium sp. J-090]